MVFLAAATGLRVSELLGMKWQDVRFDVLEIHLSRAIVDGVVGDMKTEASRKPVPLDSGLAEVLLNCELGLPTTTMRTGCSLVRRNWANSRTGPIAHCAGRKTNGE
jgi:integrase